LVPKFPSGHSPGVGSAEREREKVREEIIDILSRLRMLRTSGGPDEEFDKLSLVGETARLLGASSEDLGEALLRASGIRGGESNA